jgi:hypothetical protein
MSPGNEVVKLEETQPLSAPQVRAQVNLIQEVMKNVMQKDQHYGMIPGCGNKPSLFKAGAEKLMSTFRLAADPIVEELSKGDILRYRVTVRLLSPTGLFVGAGIGEASTNEDKYAWKKAICPDEYDSTPEDKRRVKWSNGKNGAYKVNQIRTNPSDQANTVLKMAKKRALVDAVLTATAASDIFMQDIEEMTDLPVKEAPPAKKSPTSTNEPRATAFYPATEAQVKKLNVECEHKGVDRDLLKIKYQVESFNDLSKTQASEAIDRLIKGDTAIFEPEIPEDTASPSDQDNVPF